MKIEIVDNVKEKISIDNKYVKDAIAGKVKIDKKRAEKTIIITPETFAEIFSPERIKLMLKLKRGSAQNIYQLAKGLNIPTKK